jgi:hypothetical protein
MPRQVVKRRGLFGHDRGVLPVRHEQHGGRQLDALRDGRGGAERHQRLVVGIDQPVERAER